MIAIQAKQTPVPVCTRILANVSFQLRVAKDCHCDPAEKRGKQSPVIPVKTGIQEGRMAMRPYKIASSFHSSQ